MAANILSRFLVLVRYRVGRAMFEGSFNLHAGDQFRHGPAKLNRRLAAGACLPRRLLLERRDAIQGSFSEVMRECIFPEVSCTAQSGQSRSRSLRPNWVYLMLASPKSAGENQFQCPREAIG